MTIEKLYTITIFMRRSPNYAAERIPCTIFSGNNREPTSGVIDRTPSRERASLMERIKQHFIPSALGYTAITLVEFGNGPSGITIVYGTGFMGNPTATAARLEMAEIAETCRDEEGNPASVLTLPTSSMKESVAHKILETSSFSPLAEEIAPELNRYLTCYSDRVGIVGHSFGSRLAANIPSVLDNPDKTEFVATDDAPSWQKPLGTFIAAAQLAETIDLSRYIKHSPDPEAQKAWQKNDGEKMPAVPLLVQLRDVIAMSRGGGFVEDLENSLNKLQPGTPVTLFAPELSHMNDNSSKNIRKLITSLSQEFPGLDIRGILVEDSTHNVSVANPAYFGQMIKLSRSNLQP